MPVSVSLFYLVSMFKIIKLLLLWFWCFVVIRRRRDVVLSMIAQKITEREWGKRVYKTVPSVVDDRSDKTAKITINKMQN